MDRTPVPSEWGLLRTNERGLIRAAHPGPILQSGAVIVGVRGSSMQLQ